MIEQLEKRWHDSGRFRSVVPTMDLDENGLVLGAGTVLAARDDAKGLKLDGVESRALTLLSVAYGRPIDTSVLVAIRRASKQWSEGEDCLAAMHLALTGLRKLDDPGDAARRIFIADGLMAGGVKPRDIWTALDFDTAPLDELEKFLQSEPRNPKGDGHISGEWTSDGGGAAEEAATETLASRVAASTARVAAQTFGVALGAATAYFGSTSNAMPAPSDKREIRGRPDLRYSWDQDENTLRIYRGADPYPILQAQPRGNVFRDRRGRKIGYLRATDIEFELKGLPPAWPSPEKQKDDPQPCPLPRPDRGGRGIMGGISRGYEDFRKKEVNLPPTPSGEAYWFTNPVDGRFVVIDDCQRQTGQLFEFKGNYKGFMATEWGRNIMAIDWRYQATRQWEASNGRPMEWDFADKEAADFARKVFGECEWLRGIRVEWKPYIGRKLRTIRHSFERTAPYPVRRSVDGIAPAFPSVPTQGETS